MRLRYTVRGASELSFIMSYIAKRSPQGARRVQARIKAAMEMLLLHPDAGQRTSVEGLRRVVTLPYPYLIFYSATAEEIVIHGVRHAA